MAEKIELFELDIDMDALIESSGKVEKNIIGLKSEIKDLKEDFKNGNISTQEYSKSFVNLNAQLKTNQAEQRKQTKLIQAYSDQQNKAIQIIKQTDGSINQLGAALAKNRDLYRNLSKEQRENLEIGGELKKVIDEQDKEYKELQTSIGTTAVNVGDYRAQLEGLVPGFGGATGAFQKFLAVSRAFIASPLGLILGAIGLAVGALGSYFTGTERGAQKLRVIMATLEGVLGAVKDVAIGLGEGLINAIENPREALDNLVKNVKYYFTEFIPNAINTTIEGFGLLGSAIKKVFKGDFEGAANDAVIGIQKLGDGITDLNPGTAIIKAVAGELKEVGEEAIRDAKAAGQLADQLNRIKVAERELALERAQANQRIAEAKLLAEDTTKAIDERVEAAQRAFDIENDLLNQEIALQKQRIANIAAQNALSESTEEDIQAEYDARIELARLQEQSFTKQVEINNKLNTLNQERIAKEEELEEGKRLRDEERRLAQEELQAQREAIDFEEKIAKIQQEEELEIAKLERQKELELDAAEKSIKNQELLERKKALIVNKYEKDKAKIREESAENEVQMATDVFTAIADLAGQNTVIGRVAASALATIEAYVAANKALTAGPFIGPILAVATLAKGLANVAKINSIGTETPKISKPKGFALGGYVGDDNIRIPTQPNGDNVLATLKTGEVVLNEAQQRALGGHQTFASIGVPGFNTGGVAGGVTNISNNNINIRELAQELAKANASLPNPVVVVEDINTGQERVARVESSANF